ncbi:hypothetical protein FQN55_003445 [Onygenales sp. PD_40]|nr:hypothetical protein FQN55_003445 [Onygenales sp. PD_40]KAK2764164.1 hypothetical protein FQN53_007048 [Emmonsiellopsis sp. PD_33]KAK2781438.1 hypothetical protein FQN52_001630 [Onygenales sp. PD_12]KAK2802887.1 hypothetical protein FQN51_004149 [Onygenales sp. PD_10]
MAANPVMYIGFYRRSTNPAVKTPAVELYGVNSLAGSAFNFVKNSKLELISFGCSTVAERVAAEQTIVVTENFGKIICRPRTDGIVPVVVTDSSYPERLATQLVENLAGMEKNEVEKQRELKRSKPGQTELLQNFWGTHQDSFREPPRPDAVKKATEQLRIYIEAYGQPKDFTSVLGDIQSQLDETKEVLHATIDKVLQRGEKIDSLVEKSNTLSTQSKAFYTHAKKQNSCCIVM